MITAFQDSFPCDPGKLERVKAAELSEQRNDFLSKCSTLPIEPGKGEKDTACLCILQKLEGNVDLTSGNHAFNAQFLFAAEAEDLKKEIAEYSRNYGFNSLGIDRLYMRALATCF